MTAIIDKTDLLRIVLKEQRIVENRKYHLTWAFSDQDIFSRLCVSQQLRTIPPSPLVKQLVYLWVLYLYILLVESLFSGHQFIFQLYNGM